MSDSFLTEVTSLEIKVREYLKQPYFSQKTNYGLIRDGYHLYSNESSKLIRPLVLFFACGLVGGNPNSVISAAAAVELFHTWTLIHDDIIDNDGLIKSGKNGHIFLKDFFVSKDIGKNKSAQFGKNVSMLVGDIQHSIAVSMLTRLYNDNEHEPALVLKLIHDLEYNTLSDFIDGKCSDIILSQKNMEEVEFEDIMKIIVGKNAVLLEFCAYAGAMLGLDILDNDHYQVKALSKFGYHLGIAFQLRNDINGLCKGIKEIGKPKKLDFKKKKKTFVFWYAFNKANPAQKVYINQCLQKKSPNLSEIKNITDLLIDLGGVKYTEDMLKKHIEFAKAELDKLPSNLYREHLMHLTSTLM